MSVRLNLYAHIKKYGLIEYPRETLKALNDSDQWQRAMRNLRQNEVINYEWIANSSCYLVTEINKYTKETKRKNLTERVKARIRHRDGYLCQACGKGPKDNVKLHIDHKTPIDWGGTNEDENLWTLCEKCNLGKKAYFKDDFDAEVMWIVSQQRNSYQKLRSFILNSPNKKLSPTILLGVYGKRDMERALRKIRADEKLNIPWTRKDLPDFPSGYYISIV
jgi:5-methylcytosine-specific restriction endonuclease McrA